LKMQLPEDNHSAENQAPAKLAAALKRLPEQPLFIPPLLDEAVLQAARRHLLRPTKPKWFRLVPWTASAATAMLVLAVGAYFLWQSHSVPGNGSSFAHEDVNPDGQVDILDAFALARQIQAGGTIDRRYDINGDGVVDWRDVEAIAARAVRLGKGGHS
jgi:hypothetical protein